MRERGATSGTTGNDTTGDDTTGDDIAATGTGADEEPGAATDEATGTRAGSTTGTKTGTTATARTGTRTGTVRDEETETVRDERAGTVTGAAAGSDLAAAIGPLRRRLLARGQEIGVQSAREAERRARAVLGESAISHQRINQILVRGVRTGGLSDETIASLAIAFRLAESEVRRLVAAEQYQLSEDEVQAPGDEVASVLARAREALTPAEFRQWRRAWIHHGETTVAAFRSHIAD